MGAWCKRKSTYLDGEPFRLPLLLLCGEEVRAPDAHHQLCALELNAEQNNKKLRFQEKIFLHQLVRW
jgi:hypothetical protein